MPASTYLIHTTWAMPQEPQAAPEVPSNSNPGNANTQVPGPGPAPAGSPAGCADPQMLMMVGLFMALMYFMVLRPESKRRKETAAMLATIKVGDKVITSGGMHGVIHKLEETTVILTVDQARITFDRSAIARVDRGEAATPSKA